MEVIYCFIAFTGFASYFTRGYINLGMELFSFGFLLFLGVKFLLAKSVRGGPWRSARRRGESRRASKNGSTHIQPL